MNEALSTSSLPPTAAMTGCLGVFDGALRSGIEAMGVDDIARLVEAGYRTMWVPNAAPDLGAVQALAGAVPAATIGTAIVSVWDTSPSELRAAVARIASPDRVLLGVGISHAPLVEAGGRRFDRPLSRLAAFVADLKEGPDALDPSRLLIGANGPKALALAGDSAGGAIPYLVTPEHTEHARALLGPARFLAPVQKILFGADATSARALARARLGVYWQLPNYTQSLQRQGFEESDLLGGGSDRLIDALVAWGTTTHIAERIRAHRDAGADHVAVHVLRRDGDAIVDHLEELAETMA